MPRPIEALIDAGALAHNLTVLRQRAPGARLMVALKANAYGHGIERIYSGLTGADALAVVDIDEARRLRELGWRGAILLIEGCFEPRDLEACSRLHLWHVVHRAEQIDWLAGHKTREAHQVFLKINTGMNRLGFAPQAARAAWARLAALAQVDGITLMSHLSDADGPRLGVADGIAHQLTAFDAACGELPAAASLANSAAVLRHPEASADWVRVGLAAYGASPDHPAHTAADWDLRPVMSLRAQLIAVQDVPAGGTVGYGSTFVAPAPLRIGIVACGYADGYPRVAPTGTPVRVDGVAARTVGRVSMDMLAVDLTPCPTAGPGSWVTLWGADGQSGVQPVDEVAASAGTLAYELMCALAPRVPTRTQAKPL